MPLAIGEGWTAVLGGLIPILGIGAIGWIVYRAAREPERPDSEDK